MIVTICIFGMAFLCAFFLVNPDFEANICYPKIANRIGVSPNFPSIADYVDALLIPGMSNETVLDALNKVASTDRVYIQELTPFLKLRKP
jgi:hypothetical protein